MIFGFRDLTGNIIDIGPRQLFGSAITPPDWTEIGTAYWSDWSDYIDYIVALNAAGTESTSTFGSLSGSDKWIGGVLAPNGMIYGIPLNSTTVLKIDPTTDTVSTFGSLSGTAKWVGGVLAPSGMIYGIPYSSTTVLKIDPDIDTPFSEDVPLSGYFNKL